MILKDEYKEELRGFAAKGDRGRRVAKGFTLKAPNPKSPVYYVYVWGEYHHEKSNELRKAKGTKGYSYSEGWSSLGPYGDSETLEKLKEYLAIKYGEVEENLEIVHNWLDKKKEKLEKNREKREQEKIFVLWEIISIYRAKLEMDLAAPDEYREALELVMELMKDEINAYKRKFELNDELPTTFSLRKKLLEQYHQELGEI